MINIPVAFHLLTITHEKKLRWEAVEFEETSQEVPKNTIQ